MGFGTMCFKSRVVLYFFINYPLILGVIFGYFMKIIPISLIITTTLLNGCYHYQVKPHPIPVHFDGTPAKTDSQQPPNHSQAVDKFHFLEDWF